MSHFDNIIMIINHNLLIITTSSIKFFTNLIMVILFLLIFNNFIITNYQQIITEATQSTINSNPPYSQSNLEDFKLFQSQISSSTSNHHLQALDSNLSGSFNLNTSSSSIIESMPNFYTSSQASKFRVNVSNICEKNHMHVTIRLNRPFYGLIHTKDRRKKVPCFIEGNGEQAYTLDVSYTLIQSDLSYCGVVSHHLSASIANPSIESTTTKQKQTNNHQTTLSVVLVVRLHKTIEFSDDRYFLLSCANRCSKPDCAQDHNNTSPSLLSNKNSLQAISNDKNSNLLLASETIVSPLSSRPAKDLDQNRVVPLDGSILTEKCDTMLDLKFKWLIRVCFILTILLALFFCIALYLCLTINKRKSLKRDRTKLFDRKNQQAINKSSTTTNSKKAANNNNKTTSSYAQSESLSWSTLTPTTNDELNKIREDNSYLAQQNQQLLLANMLANSNKTHLINNTSNILDINNNNGQNNYQINSADSKQQFQQPIVVGRSNDSNFNGIQRINYSNDNVDNNISYNIKRRRSIGGSSVAPIFLSSDTNNNVSYKTSIAHGHQQAPATLGHVHHDQRFDLNQRAKSRSQTTIYYEQNQDPFKTIPFNIINNGYLSDGTTTRRICLTNNSNHDNEDDDTNCNNFINLRTNMQQHDNNNNNNNIRTENAQLLHNHHHQDYLVYPQLAQQLDESMTHSLPAENIIYNNDATKYNSQQQQLSKRWANSKQTHAPTGNNQMHFELKNNAILSKRQQQISSQFDPQQNSHQLIDLIQQKHKQQIEQANRTAAALGPPSSSEQLFHQHVSGSTRQIHKHRHNDSH